MISMYPDIIRAMRLPSKRCGLVRIHFSARSNDGDGAVQHIISPMGYRSCFDTLRTRLDDLAEKRGKVSIRMSRTPHTKYGHLRLLLFVTLFILSFNRR